MIYAARSLTIMKPFHHPLLPIGLAAWVPAAVLAIEPPADNSPPPAAPEPLAQHLPRDAAPAAAQAVAPYLGIGTCPVPPLLASHLDLKPGEGVVIRVIDPNGPAAKAGLAEHDVILRIAGQPVASHADLAKAIQRHQSGEEITIDLIHQGQPATQSIPLASRPEDANLAAPAELDNLRLDGMPADQFKRIREAIDRQLRAMEGGGLPPQGGLGGDAIKDAEKRMDEAQQRMAEARKRMADALQPGAGGIKMHASATIRIADDEGTIEMKSVDGGKEASVRDKAGKEIWSGPWDTAQDKAAAPPGIRARLEKLNLDPTFKGQGLRLQLGRPFGAPAEPEPKDEDAEEPAPEEPEGGPVE
ncbi:MAG: hypothetical protein RLZZ522_1470 [Verrucomicrobiota bacterium]